MIETFVHRAELTSPHGTGSELRKQQREALAAIEKDRAAEGKENGGLFKGMFNKKKPHRLRGFRDPADGITRCPNCSWEVEDGLCTACGLEVLEPRGNVFSDSDEDESDESDDSDSESDSDGPRYGRGPEQEFEDEEDDDDDEEDDDDDDDDDDDEEDDEDDEEADEWQDEEDIPGYNVDSPGNNTGHSGPHGINQPRELFHRIHRIHPLGPNRNIPTPQNASQEFRRANVFSVFPSSEAEEGGRSDDTEGSLADFVEHDTPENPRRFQRENARSGNNSAVQQITIDSSPILISSTPAAPSNVPPRRRGRPVVLEDEDEHDSSFSGASPGQSRLRSINDFPTWEDDIQQFGYSPLGEVTTASENDDDTLSSPPGRRLQRGGPPSSGGGGSVPSVPEEDEESGSGRFGDNDDSEDQDGDIVMTGTRGHARRGANGTNGQRRTQNRGGNRTRPVEVQDSESDLDIQPRPARRNGRSNTSSSNRQTHGRNVAGNNRSTNSRGRFNPNLQNIFSAHHQQREQTQYDALVRYSVSPARSITPVQRQHTGESRRASTPLRSVEQSNPPLSPLIRLSNDPPTPTFAPQLPSSLPLSPRQSPAQNPRQNRAGGPGPPAEHQIINNSRPILSNPPADMQQARTGSIAVAAPGLRVRGRNSRQQLRGTSSRVGLRGGSITPTQTLATGNLAARRPTVSLERDAIFARGAAIRRQQVPPRDPAGTQLGRRNSRISLNSSTNQPQNQPTAIDTSRVTARSGQQVGSASGRIGVPIANGPVSQPSGGPLWALSDDRS